jgi:hypothetical protein
MITIGYSTRKSNPEYKEYIQKTCMYKEVQIIEKVNNGDKSLSQVYNEIIEESNHDIVVLIHDDLEFDTNKWGDKLLKNFNKNPEYGILGLAGTKYFDESAMWWKVPHTMYGIVNHKHQGKKWTSQYSRNINDKIEDVVLVDGLFIAFDKRKIKSKFDDDIEGFHFYDLGFCLPNFLNNVKIGVIFNIRVTHLSIGQTNQQWENNRILFSEKYKNILPIDMTKTEEISETFIFVHDQELILKFEESNKFLFLKNYKYVFLGKRETDKIDNNSKVIIAKNFKDNLEDYPLFTSFTGWHLLWKNNLITKKYVNLFEYDIIVDKNIEQIQSKFFYENLDVLGYVPHSTKTFHYINNKNWVEHIFEAIKTVYKIDIEKKIRDLINTNPNLNWSATSNHTFRKEVFDEFMKWFEPLIPFLKDTKTCGHAHERAISFFYFLSGKKISIIPNVIKHFQMNSHQTQGHKVDYDSSIKKIISNQE